MIKALSWIGTAASIVGSFVVASKLFTIGYCLFLIGSVSWLIVGATRKDGALIALNGAFLVANMLGLYNAVV